MQGSRLSKTWDRLEARRWRRDYFPRRIVRWQNEKWVHVESWSFHSHVFLCSYVFIFIRFVSKCMSNYFLAIAFLQHEDLSSVSFIVLFFFIALARLAFFSFSVSKMIPFVNRVLIINVTRDRTFSRKHFPPPLLAVDFNYFSSTFVIKFCFLCNSVNKYFILEVICAAFGILFTINGEFSFVLRSRWTNYCNLLIS